MRWTVPALAIVWPGVVLATDAIEPIGVSVPARARGGADVAVGDSALSQIENPATLTLQPRGAYRIDFSGQLIQPHSHWSGLIDSADAENSLPPAVNIGLALPVDDRFTWGVAFHSKSGMGARYHLRHITMPFIKRRVHSDMKDIAVLVNAAYKLTDKLSVGAGVRGEAATGEFGTVLGVTHVEFGRGYAFGGGYQVGLHYQARDDLAFGVGYRSKTWLNDMEGGHAEAFRVNQLPLELGDVNIDEYRLPRKAHVGVAWDTTDWLKLVGEVRWTNYADSSAHSTLYATDGPVDIRLPVSLGYHDQWAFMGGTEFKLDEHWRLGLGYHYCTNPVSASRMMPIGSIITQHHITTGLRYEAEHWWVGGGYIIALPASMTSRRFSKIPLGIDYGSGTIRQWQQSVFFGFGFSW